MFRRASSGWRRASAAASADIEVQSPLVGMVAGTPITVTSTKGTVFIDIDSADAAITLTAVPTISDGLVDGQELVLRNRNAAGAITFQDETALAGSNLRLGAGTAKAHSPNDLFVLRWNAGDSEWQQQHAIQAI